MNPLGRGLAKTSAAIQRELQLRRGKILSATFGMTYKCNLTCETCGVWVRGETDTQTELTTAEILDTARELVALGVRQTILVGSEPLLRRDALEVIEQMSAMGLDVLVITNGTLITEKAAERMVRAGTQGVVVSIDAVGELHNRIRGQDRAYERALAGFVRLKEAKERLGSDRPDLGIHATISAYNTHALDEISALSDELGVEVSFQLASETSPEEVSSAQMDGRKIAGPTLIPRRGTFLPDEEGVKRIRAFLGKPGILDKHPSLHVLSAMSDDDILHGRFPVKSCQVLRGQIMIDPYGEVYPCSHLDEYSYGNVKNLPVAEIWSGIRRKAMLDRVNAELYPICAKCCHHSSNFTVTQKARMVLQRALS